MRRRRLADRVRIALVCSVLSVAQGFSPAVSAQDPPAASRAYAILVAEDARAILPDQFATLVRGTKDASPDVQRIAVRALGRLEREAAIEPLVAALAAASARVRAEAANALAQSLTNIGDDPNQTIARVESALKAALENEADPIVRGAVLHSIGRLPFRNAVDRARVARELSLHLSTASGPEGRAPIVAGVLRGLESLFRGWTRPFAVDPEVLARIDRSLGSVPGVLSAAPVRRLVLTASLAANHASADAIAFALRDVDDQVRRLGVLAAALPGSTVDLRPLIAAAIHDPSPMVRLEALRIYGRRFQSTDCDPLVRAATGPRPRMIDADAEPEVEAVVLLALDLVGDPCPAAANVADLLARESASDSWRRAAHAFVSLARVAPDRARPMLASMTGHRVWQVRMYAARAAAALRDGDALLKLAADSHDNVRESAIGALVPLRGHAADDVYIGELARKDYQLVRTAARALQGTPKRKAAADALAVALDRITREGRETSRDARLALLERLREIGSPAQATIVERCVNDIDRRVATECALALLEWNGKTATVTVPPAARPPLPSPADLAALAGARARVTMAGGKQFELTLLTDEAPLSVARFARLARAGYYNGLTFHRVVPNFVIQGGSPGANEYVGDGPFMRDEVGLVSHSRGTVGVSTRGRDTGDAQIFVNLVDNTRLDHVYTVFADVTGGMDVVDAVEEGDVIEKIEILFRGAGL